MRGGLRLLALLLLGGLGGCAAPYAAYTRPSGAVVAPGVYRVPAGWDYRQDWQVPAARLRSIAASYVGTPYRYGGTTRRGLDCSGLVYLVYRELAHATLPRSTRRLKRVGDVVDGAEARCGDLAFFATEGVGVNHVGLCLGEGRFAHASSSRGVMVSGLGEEYYRSRLVYLRRVF